MENDHTHVLYSYIIRLRKNSMALFEMLISC